MKKAIIIGVTGQDGSYMAEHLLHKGYEVHGIVSAARGYGEENVDRSYISPGREDVPLMYHECDTSDPRELTKLVYDINPDEVYHFESRGRMNVRYDMHEFSGDITGLSSLMVLEAVKQSGVGSRYCQASSCGIYGSTYPPQNETSPFRPHSPYACAKAFAFYATRNFREAYGMFACNGILFNHESPRRGETFVTRKITRAVAGIACAASATAATAARTARRSTPRRRLSGGSAGTTDCRPSINRAVPGGASRPFSGRRRLQ